MSPTQLTLKYFRTRNTPACVVERWIPGANIRRDIWHADIQVLYADCIIGIQCGAHQHHADKIKKATAHPEVRQWLSSPTRKFHIWTWKKRPALKKDGGRKKRDEWAVRVTELVLVDGKIVAKPFELK